MFKKLLKKKMLSVLVISICFIANTKIVYGNNSQTFEGNDKVQKSIGLLKKAIALKYSDDLEMSKSRLTEALRLINSIETPSEEVVLFRQQIQSCLAYVIIDSIETPPEEVVLLRQQFHSHLDLVYGNNRPAFLGFTTVNGGVTKLVDDYLLGPQLYISNADLLGFSSVDGIIKLLGTYGFSIFLTALGIPGVREIMFILGAFLLAQSIILNAVNQGNGVILQWTWLNILLGPVGIILYIPWPQ